MTTTFNPYKYKKQILQLPFTDNTGNAQKLLELHPKLQDMGMSKCMWLEFLGYPNYVLNQEGMLYNFNNKRLRNMAGAEVIMVSNRPNHKKFQFNQLMAKCFGSEIDEVADHNKKSLEFLGFPNHTVTRDGRVWSDRRYQWIKPHKTPKGYYSITFTVNGKSYGRRLNRLVALAFIPNLENKPEVNHKDGNKENNNDWNLEWCTRLENQQHAIRTGLISNHSSKETATSICELLQKGYTNRKIIKEYGFSGPLVSKIRCRAIHRDISKDYSWSPSRKTQKSDPEVIKKVCKLLAQGKSINKIWKRLRGDASKEMIRDIKHRRKYQDISEEYSW